MEVKDKLILLFCCLIVFLIFNSTALASEEARGLWVIRDQLTDPSNIDEIINTAVENNFNLLFVQVCGRGDAYYQSEILPRSRALNNQPRSFDPLKNILVKAHEHKIKVHAWMNAMYVAPLQARHEPTGHIIYKHPEWLTYNYKGISVLNLTKNDVGMEVPGMFLEPGLQEVRDYLNSIYLEVASNYSVDGIHFDFIRYANPNFGYHPQVREDFKKIYGVDPLDLRQKKEELREELGRKKWKELTKQWDQYRRDQISEVVKQAYQNIKKVDPQIEVSAACIGYYHSAYNDKMQDWKKWLEEGYLDIAVPMIYEPDTLNVNWMVDEALKIEANSQGTVFPGLGAYTQINNVQSLIEKVNHVREKKAKGVAFFAYRVMKNKEGYFGSLKKELFSEPADYPEVLNN